MWHCIHLAAVLTAEPCLILQSSIFTPRLAADLRLEPSAFVQDADERVLGWNSHWAGQAPCGGHVSTRAPHCSLSPHTGPPTLPPELSLRRKQLRHRFSWFPGLSHTHEFTESHFLPLLIPFYGISCNCSTSGSHIAVCPPGRSPVPATVHVVANLGTSVSYWSSSPSQRAGSSLGELMAAQCSGCGHGIRCLEASGRVMPAHCLPEDLEGAWWLYLILSNNAAFFTSLDART